MQSSNIIFSSCTAAAGEEDDDYQTCKNPRSINIHSSSSGAFGYRYSFTMGDGVDELFLQAKPEEDGDIVFISCLFG